MLENVLNLESEQEEKKKGKGERQLKYIMFLYQQYPLKYILTYNKDVLAKGKINAVKFEILKSSSNESF